MSRRLDVVITRLSQSHRPAPRRPLPPPRAKTAIMRAERPPLHFYRYLYDVIGRDYHWVSRRTLTDAALRDIIHRADIAIYVLSVDGAPAGMAELNMRREQEFELSFFGLIPERIGQGLGRYFLTHIVEIAWDLGAETFSVETCTLDHPAALPLYQKLGFEVVSQRDGVVETGDAPAANA